MPRSLDLEDLHGKCLACRRAGETFTRVIDAHTPMIVVRAPLAGSDTDANVFVGIVRAGHCPARPVAFIERSELAVETVGRYTAIRGRRIDPRIWSSLMPVFLPAGTNSTSVGPVFIRPARNSVPDRILPS